MSIMLFDYYYYYYYHHHHFNHSPSLHKCILYQNLHVHKNSYFPVTDCKYMKIMCELWFNK